MKTCAPCSLFAPDSEAVCPKCGAELKPCPEPNIPAHAERSPGNAIAFGPPIVIGTVLLILIGIWWLGSSSDGPDGAITACEQAVRENLLAPASARLDPSPKVIKQGAVTWNVYGYVDSQNRFGAMLRGDYNCYATGAEGHWKASATIRTRD